MVEKFIFELEKQGLMKSTIDSYLFDINQFYEWSQKKNLDNQISKENLNKYILFLNSMYNENTVLRKIKSIIRYNKFLYHSGESILKIEVNEIMKIPKKKGVMKIIEINDLIRIRQVILECNNKRDILIFHLIVTTGCRVSELINMELDDIEIINASKGFIRLNNFKSSNIPNGRKIEVTEDLIKIINEYLEVRPVNQSNKLLIGQQGPLTRDAINKMFRKYSVMANIKYIVSTDMIRRFAILYMINKLEKKNELEFPYTVHQPIEPSILKYYQEKLNSSDNDIDFECFEAKFINLVRDSNGKNPEQDN